MRFSHLRECITTVLFGLVCIGNAGAADSVAEAYPVKPIRYVVPAPPGGLIDAMARAIGNEISPVLGQAVVVDNRPGGNTNLGTEYVARSAPDGYTWLAVSMTLSANATLFPKLPFDPRKDFIPVARLALTPMGIAVPASSPYGSIQEVIQAARGGKTINVGSSGYGTPPHLALAMFESLTGTKLNHIPYKGGAQALNDLLGAQVDLMFTTLSESGQFIKAGKLKLLAVTSETRISDFPQIPTSAEAGVPGLRISGWTGMVMPARTPAPVVAKVSDAIMRVMSTPAMVNRLTAMGYVPAPQRPDEFAVFFNEEVYRWGTLIKEKNIKPD